MISIAEIIVDIFMILILTSFMPLACYSYFRTDFKKKESEFANTVKKFSQIIPSFKEINFKEEYEYKTSDYYFPVFFASLIILAGMTALIFGQELNFAKTPSFLLSGSFHYDIEDVNVFYREKSIVAMTFGFLGGLIWSLYYVTRRILTIDLVPSVFYSVSLRIIFAMTLALIFRHLIENNLILTAQLPVIAFLTGFLPESMFQYLLKKTKILKNENKAKDMPLEMIEGMNTLHKARLADLGIDDAQNLAKANIIKLIIQSPFNDSTLLDWIGQAKLYIYFKDDVKDLREKCSIRTTYDFYEAVKTDNDIINIAAAAGINAEKINSYKKIIEKTKDELDMVLALHITKS